MKTALKRLSLAVAVWVACTGMGLAQETAARVGVLDTPCAFVEPVPAVVTAYMARVEAAKKAKQPAPVPSADDMKIYKDWQARLLVTDFGGRCRYDAENAKLPAPTGNRVIFFGDSITELWGRSNPEFFAGDIINRGISGQTTDQMLVRFQSDVIALRPRIVHIIAGTNDIGGNTGPTRLAWVEANITAMVDLAKLHGIRVVLGTVPPAAHFGWRPEIKPIPAITAYNRWLSDFAKRGNIVLVDYYRTLDDGKGGISATLSGDGVHPNAEGYTLMLPLARRGISAATQ